MVSMISASSTKVPATNSSVRYLLPSSSATLITIVIVEIIEIIESEERNTPPSVS